VISLLQTSLISADLTTCNKTLSTILLILRYNTACHESSSFDTLFNVLQMTSYSLTANTPQNQTIDKRIPNLALADKELHQYFRAEKEAHFDLQIIINRTREDVPVYNSLAHYLFNSILKARSKQGDFDYLSPCTWLTICSWLSNILTLISAVTLRYKVRSLSVLLLVARPVRTAPIPGYLKF